MLDNDQTLDRTSGRITNAQRIGEESEAIGAGVLSELDSQRQTIMRTGGKVSNVDANLSKSRRILNAMSRRIMTNHLVMMLVSHKMVEPLPVLCPLTTVCPIFSSRVHGAPLVALATTSADGHPRCRWLCPLYRHGHF